MASEAPPSTADYWIGPIIGQGAFAQVHYAKHKESHRKVAIKVIDQVTVRKYPKLLAGLLQEQKLLSGSLRGVNCVAQLGSSFYDSSCLYMVMELCEGGDLDTWILQEFHGSRTKINEDEERDGWIRSIPSYLSQVREAIDAVHAYHVVHCDIKPANILLSSKGKVRLADFGSAWDLSNPSSKLDDGLRGTTEYSSPELIRNQVTDVPKALDYWSFGCLVLALYTGQSPFFQQGSQASTVQAILDYEKNEDRDSWLEQVWNRGKYAAFIDEDIRILHRGLLHPDQTKRNKAWLSLTELETPGVDSIKRTSTSLRLSSDGKPLLHEANWRETVENCEMQDGALGWSVFFV